MSVYWILGFSMACCPCISFKEILLYITCETPQVRNCVRWVLSSKNERKLRTDQQKIIRHKSSYILDNSERAIIRREHSD